MTWVAELCAEIRQVVASPETTGVEELARLLERYNRAVDEINGRLRRAGTMLGQGLRAEALGYIEAYPDALDSARELELGYSWGLWADAVVQADVGDARAIDRDLAAEFNQAYDADPRFEQALDHYRRIALVSGPARDQIEALRYLARLEPENPVWQERRKELEAVRLRMINKQAKIAVDQDDLAAAEGLLGELQDNRWLVLPPERFVSMVADAVSRLRAQEALRLYDELAEQLHEAYGAYDEQRVADLLSRWAGVESSLGVPPAPHAADEIAPIAAWLVDRTEAQAQKAEAAALTTELERHLDDHAPIDEVSRVHARLQRVAGTVPPDLDRLYQSRCAEAAAVQSQRRKVIAMAAVLAIVALGGATGFYVRHQSRDRELARFRGQVLEQLNAEPAELDAASRLFEQVGQGKKAWLLAEPEVISLKSRTEMLVAERGVQREAFEQALARLKGMSFDDPEAWTVLSRADELVAPLPPGDRLALQTQRDRLETDLSSYIDSLAAEHARRREEFKQTAENVRTAAREAPDVLQEQRLILEGLAPVESGLVQLISGAAAQGVGSEYLRQRVREDMKTVRAATEAELTRVRADLAEARATHLREQARIKALDRIRETRGDVAKLIPAMNAYLDEYPEVGPGLGRYAKWFDSALDDEGVWQALRPWNDLATSIGSDLSVKSLAEVHSRQQAIEAVIAVLPESEHGLAPYVEYLARAEAALAPSGLLASNIDRLIERLDQPWFRDMTCLEVTRSDGSTSRYYSFAEPSLLVGIGERESHVFRLPRWVRTLDEVAEESLAKDQYITLPSVSSPRLETAPHVKVGQALRAAVTTPRAIAKWDHLFLELAQIARDQPMDDVLRAQLLAYLLDAQEQVGWQEVPGLDPFIAEADTLLDVAWPSPTDPAAEEARVRAREIIEDLLPDLADRESAGESLRGFTVPSAFAQAGLVWYDEAAASPIVVGAESTSGLVWIQMADGRLVPKPVEVDDAGRITEGGPPPGTPLFRLDEP